MSICQYRCRKHIRPRDALQRLRALRGEPKTTTTTIEDWLDVTTYTAADEGSSYRQPLSTHLPPPSPPPSSAPDPPTSSSVPHSQSLGFMPKAQNGSPLQPTHGNRALSSPRIRLKRKMPEGFGIGLRHSARIRNMTSPESTSDGLGAEEPSTATVARGRRTRKPTTGVAAEGATGLATEGATGLATEGARGLAAEGARGVAAEGARGVAAEGAGGLAADGARRVAAEGARGRSTLNIPRHFMAGEALASFGKPFADDRPIKQADLQKRLFNEGAANREIAVSTPSSRSKKSSSPSKASKALNKRARMQFLEPRIVFRTLIATKNDGDLTGKLQRLWLDHINRNDQGIIPSEFKEAMSRESDTPNKTKPSIPDSYFDTSHARYAKEDLTLIQLTIWDVLGLADKYRHSDCTEPHWTSIVINPLLNLVRRLRRYQKNDSKLAIVDLTVVEISPSTLCPTSSDSLFKDLDKRIDAAIGLDLSSTKHAILAGGVYSEGSLPSINQTASFVNFTPMFVNIEVKKQNSDRDPLIQLGSWIAAEFTKRKMEGYSLDMPVLAIEIEGDDWKLHVVFAIDDPENDTFQCNFMGPIEIGSTRTIVGIFQILDMLCRCADWGIGGYQQWFNGEVLSKYGKG